MAPTPALDLTTSLPGDFSKKENVRLRARKGGAGLCTSGLNGLGL